MTNLSQAQTLVFISSSMPVTSVAQWLTEAKAHGDTTLVMRGFVGNNLAATKAWVGQVLAQSHERGGITIDPRLFDQYHINRVPAVVANNQLVYGNVSLATALGAIHG